MTLAQRLAESIVRDPAIYLSIAMIVLLVTQMMVIWTLYRASRTLYQLAVSQKYTSEVILAHGDDQERRRDIKENALDTLIDLVTDVHCAVIPDEDLTDADAPRPLDDHPKREEDHAA